MEEADKTLGKVRGRWRRWGEHALGMAIEFSAVCAISLAALLIMFIIKAIVR